MKKRVLLGMSGGIDSSVAAMLLLEKGYEVVGITFLFSGTTEANSKTITGAKNLASTLQIEHQVVDLREVFKNTVIRYFKAEYIAGRTPFPCAYCNPKIKFYYLEEYSKKLNCKYIATGHYARIEKYEGKNYIFQGVDNNKDQSFFLWGLSQKLIDKLIFPLGDYDKQTIKNIANERGFFSLVNQKESLGICFIEGNNYRKFLQKEGIKSNPGFFVDAKGTILGKHLGITNYTIGQRRGLGLKLNYPVFVAKFLLDENKIVLGKYTELYKNKLLLKDTQILDNQVINTDEEIIVKVRYRLQETPCRINILNESRVEVVLLKPEAMIADGQTAVFYHNDRLIGGGFIASSE